MDRPDKRNRKAKKPPRVPIKTYRWEDVRRSRKRGGYPWTHLYKQPYTETIDPSQFRMDSLSRSKSTLNSGDGVSIQEVSDDGRDQSDSIQIVSEPDENSSAHPGRGTSAATGNVTIEECHSSDEKPNLESAESSDNISQYLDKEEQPAKASTSATIKEKETTVENVEKQRAKSEEPKRKRKLSAESSYSRISLSKLGIMKKLKEGKDKLKATKISLPINKFKKPVPKKMNAKKETKKQQEASRLVISDKPVYIHIPLKPPPGQTDEFSYLEFEEKRPATTTTTTTSTTTTSTTVKQPLKINPAFKDLLKNIKKLNEEKAIQESKSQENVNAENILKTEEKTEALKPKEFTEEQHKKDQDSKQIKEFEKMETEAEIKELKQDNEEIFKKVKKTKDECKSKDEDISFKMEIENIPSQTIAPSTSKGFDIEEEVIDTDLQYDEEPKKSVKEDEIINVDFDELFKNKPVELKVTQKTRAKSEEPERKRKLSLESSYSRKSLSKLGIMKKLKETSNKIKSTLSLSRLTSKKESKKEKEKPQAEVKPTPKKIKPAEISKDPVYIHIPLKPPEGQTDEFSYLEFEEKSSNAPAVKKIEETPTESTPPSIPPNDVQIIFLTAPSDDEVLDEQSPEIPETPSSDQTTFFRIDDLKELAKNVVDKLSPETRRKHLETVSEETVSKTSNDEDVMVIEEIDPQKLQVPINSELDPNREDIITKMMVDEEDGLKFETKDQFESETKEAKKTTDGKDELKVKESPVLKKKVSFKRRSKDKDDDYEDVQPPTEQKGDENVLKTTQSMSVEEEKPYLDEKIIKSASLEEDYNKWSKSSDHEYEPVNPPTDNTPAETPTVRIIEAPTSKWIIGEDAKEEEKSKIKRPTPERIEVKSESETSTSIQEEQPRGTSKFQKAFKNKTNQFKTKLKSIKRPNISMPQAPKFQKPNFNFPHLPKIPDTTVIHLPFKIPGSSTKTTTTTTTTTKRSLNERQLSTESNAGDSKKPLFDFSTYPRIFKRKSQPKKLQSQNVQAFATVPRNEKKKSSKSNDKWGGKDTIRIPLHSEDSMDQELKDDFTRNDNETFRDDNFREDSVEKRMSSHIRYDDDIDIDDDYHRENQQIHEAAQKKQYSRWDHGNFVAEPNKEYIKSSKHQVTDLDSPEDETPQQFESKPRTDSYYSSESSLGTHRRGVLEEINSDEFFLRQKGISQDNIDMGIYLSSEIREAFKTPTGAVSHMERYGSNTSLPEIERYDKRKPMRKPKRKKTPHVSQEQIKSDFTSHMLPPARPKRTGKKKKPVEEFIPYQETIPVEPSNEPLEEMGILARSDEEPFMYENEKMEGKEQPEIKVTDPYIDYFEEEERYLEDKPPAPPRRHKSLTSLSSEHNSIITDSPFDKDYLDNSEIAKNEANDYIIPEEKPPRRPARKRSRTRSQSRASSSMPTEEELQYMQENYSTDDAPCAEEISYTDEQPCLEEPCIKNICDYMGYSVVDKSQIRDPPLPPPRTPPRRRRSIRAEETKFDTVPRMADKPPVRPLRNYSTLSPSRTSSRISAQEKENIDITQYIEIDDESRADLKSGKIIQKMQNRPLPAPPRPPRHKAKPLKDITSEENIMKRLDNESDKKDTQHDYECEEEQFEDSSAHETQSFRRVEPQLITPSHYTYNEETITHGSLIVQPLNGSQILPDSELIKESRERIIPISREDSDEETSEIPEEFKSYKDPPVKEQPERKSMKGGKLQVTDLDVDRLTVNELMASKIVVSEIDSNNIQTTEISSKSGALKVGEISLPPGVVHDILEQLKAAVEERAAQELVQEEEEKQETSGQKKTSDNLELSEDKCFIEKSPLEESQINNEEIVERIAVDEPPQPPPRSLQHEEAPPERPTRHSRKLEDSDKSPQEPDLDDEPPPRPPQPEYEQIGYIPSQPPASFYALKAQKYVESVSTDNIPVVPRRRRYPKPVSRSTSEEESAVRPSAGGHRRHLRSSSCEPSIPQLTGQLVRACGSVANHQLKRLINHITDNVLGNRDGQQDMHVMIVILLVLIAGLILLGYGEEKTVVHLHHWEYFNPPRDM